MKLKRLNQLALALAAAGTLVLAGCGGGGGSAPAPGEPSGPSAPEVPTVAVSGIVADGLLQNAKVCLDVNGNRACDDSEPASVTDASGAYTINTAVGTNFPVLAIVTAGVTTDSDYGAIDRSYMLMSPAGKPEFVSPYTTLVQSEIDSGRSLNLRAAESAVLAGMVGTAGQVGGLGLYSNYVSAPGGTSTAQLRMYGAAQLLARGFAETQDRTKLSGLQLSAALGQGVSGAMKQVLSQVTGTLTAVNRDTLFSAMQDSLVPTTATLAAIARAKASTGAQPIEGAWTRQTGAHTELFIFAGDGTFVHQTVAPGVTSTTAFDSGFGYRYGRYTFEGGVLTTSLIEASGQSGPGNEAVSGITIAGDAMTGGLVLTRLASATNPLVGAWMQPNGSDKPQYLVFLDDGKYVHSTFYREDDFETGSATALETARTLGLQRGAYVRETTASGVSLINFGEIDLVSIGTTGSPVPVDFNGNLSIPGNPGVAVYQADGSVSIEGARFVKLGTAAGATVVSGLSEATRSQLWSGRWFSRSLGGSPAVTQYVYVRGPADVITINQMPSGSDVTAACPVVAGIFTSLDPADGLLKQMVIGTGTNANTGYAQRRMNVGTPGAFTVYTPAARPSNATARCALPV
ncbi:MAG: hypothetical protein ABW051_02210 [Burkholderiaceae bacterium]